MRVITFDIETVGTFSRVRGDYSGMNITVVGVHDSTDNSLTAYTVEELPKLWPILQSTDLLVGYNSDSFDIPILNRYYPGDLTLIPSLDILTKIYEVLDRRIRLEAVAQGTLKKGKSGEGSQAHIWWEQGHYEKVKKYCLDDVALTRELFDYALEHKSLKFKDLGGVKEMKIDTSTWLTVKPKEAQTHILPL
jgi:hypothetical protein